MVREVDSRGGPANRADHAVTKWSRVVLVGFMGSGKTTVGRLLARRIGWRFVDLDDEVEAAEGMSVEDLFRKRGESEFRVLEARAGAAALAKERTVLAPGGGWCLTPGRLEELPPGSLSVWLTVSPETAVRRATSVGGRVRPLLAGPDPVARARSLMNERELFYARAHLHVDVESATPQTVADRIAEFMEGGR